jgi:hypothetical protein
MAPRPMKAISGLLAIFYEFEFLFSVWEVCV